MQLVLLAQTNHREVTGGRARGCHGQRDAHAGRTRISSASGSTPGWAPSRSCSTYAGNGCRSGLASTVARGLRLSTQTSDGCQQSRPSSPTWDHPTSTAGPVIMARRPCLPGSLFEDMLPVVVLEGPNGPGVTSLRRRIRPRRRIRRHRRTRHRRRTGRRRPGGRRPGVPHLGGRRSSPGRIRARRSCRRRRARRR
jgi:hypothetical protein